ncbi:hypothetical protein [Larkinella rosea]|uniref:TIGR02646 family protein n=1 Tax=Larkinella rosea TaxID=2025312 RepID=A0A3P1BS80_9BACT|nr:hypothetical protein [Larkinella rosea]RRB03965.1 hypothetical protein EHT25_10560 [Larkinella rosea]
MRKIEKPNQDPDPLLIFKSRQIAAGVTPRYSDFQNPEKAEYVLELLREQGYLCAYCNVTLDFGDDIPSVREAVRLKYISIEHWFPQHKCIGLLAQKKLEHKNLLGVCGGLTDAHFHCDKQRSKFPVGEQDLTINPVYLDEISCEDLITFEDGSIKSATGNVNIDNDLDNILNLNCIPLINRRKAVEQGYIEALNVLEDQDEVDLNDTVFLKKLYKDAYENLNGRGKEDCMVIADLLKLRILSL